MWTLDYRADLRVDRRLKMIAYDKRTWLSFKSYTDMSNKRTGGSRDDNAY
jgi:hypothetical protein